MIKEITIPVILGPTASGKTSVGIELAKMINAEVISVDSRKVYKGLLVGTATPKGEWKGNSYWVQGISHHLMGHLSADVPYTAGDFAKDAERLISDILGRNKVPLLVGGTGFYFKALQNGLPRLPNRNEEYREKLEQRIKKGELPQIFQDLEKVDPVAAHAIGSNDPHKIIRALEVTQLTGLPFSSWKNTKAQNSSHAFTVLGLDFPKQLLDHRIELRSKRMADQGMIAETAALLKSGYPKTCPALSSFGYKEAVQVIEGNLSPAEFLTALIKGTKSYSKRQRTWFRTQVKPIWFECDENSTKEEIAMKMKDFWGRLN